MLRFACSGTFKRIVTAFTDNTARQWDVETRKPIGEPLTGHASDVWSAAFSPDGRRIVTGSHDGTARLWDVETGKPISEPLNFDEVAEAEAQGLPYVLVPRELSREELMERYSSQAQPVVQQQQRIQPRNGDNKN
jgi:WD40 repeat protein